MYFCDLCKKRRIPNSTFPDEASIAEWIGSRLDKNIDQSINPVCAYCSGTLQNGSVIVDVIRNSIEEAAYDGVFGCILSVQFPPYLLFRQYIERVVYMSRTGASVFSGVRDVLRGMIHNAVITETYSNRMPKLFVEVVFQCLEELDEGVPIELMKAVNAEQSRKLGRKHFKSRQSVNISDVQQFMEKTKDDLSLVYLSLFPGSSTETQPNVEDMTQMLEVTFLNTPPFVPSITVSLKRETVYLVGNYVKDTRDFGQSQWDAHETSVAETICPSICEIFKSSTDKCLFSASGREDMDVRMLGEGRSFVVQLGDAKSVEPLLSSGSVLKNFSLDTGDVRLVGGLRWVDKGVMDWLHWSTEQHLKVYRCIVWTEAVLPIQNDLESIFISKKNIKIFQKTPLRVLHRRTEQTREKTIYSLKGDRLNDHFAIFTLHASAGAYIKEFVHGDFGRTSPCFADLVFGKHVKCDILQLDVLEVQQEEEEQYVPLWDR